MKVICFGDSLTTCGRENGRFSDILQDRFPQHEFVNKGVGGESWVDARARFDADVCAAEPDVVLLEFGANDWWRDERPYTQWVADLEYVLSRLSSNGVKVVVLGVFGDYLDDEGNRVEKTYGIDPRAIQYRGEEARVAKLYGSAYIANIQEWIVDRRCCWMDRNHPNEYGNRHVADAIEPALAAVLDDQPLPVRKPNLAAVRDLWREAVALTPDAVAAVDGERRVTFLEADAMVRSLAAGLRYRCGDKPPRVAVCLPNCLEYFLLYWAVMDLGGAIVPLNTFLKAEALAAIFRNIQPDALIVSGADDRVPLAAATENDVPLCVSLASADGTVLWSELMATAAGAPTAADVAGDDVAIVMHTSGTTGVPKGAVMRQSDILFNIMVTINAQDFVPSDRHLLVNPMFHATALYSSLPAAAYQGAPVIITADTSPTGLMRLVQDEQITTFLTVPAILQRIVSLPNLSEFDASSLRVIAYAGSMMPVTTIRKLQALFPGVELHNFFGLTETTSATHVLDGADADERPDSIGRLLPFVEAIVVDESFETVPPGTVGQLLFARDNVISEYINQPERLAAALIEIDGRQWFQTGDLAAMDEEGYFFIKGRKKDMIIVGGENVYAAEVEAVLMACDGVDEAAVKAVPATGVRESLGELIRAYVVVDPAVASERDLRKHCHQRLASYQVPHEWVFLDALPRNPSGKVVKADLPD